MMIRDFYTRLWLPIQYHSREHVIPRSLLKPVHRSDRQNIVITDTRLNNFRSNYRFAEIPLKELHNFPRHLPLDIDCRQLNTDLKCFYSIDIQRQIQILVALQDPKEKLFYPLMSHNKIARIINRMLHKYKYLKLENIFVTPMIYRRWYYNC